MPTQIITKNSSTAASVPLAADLVQGELAVNVTDKRIHTKDSSNAVVELGVNPSSLAVDTDSFYVDTVNSRIGVNTLSPAERLHIQGANSETIGLRLASRNSTSDSTRTTITQDGDTGKFTVAIDPSGNGSDRGFVVQLSNQAEITIDANGYIHAGSSTAPLWASGSGTPEGSVTAPVGSFYSRTDGGAGTSFYVKESGSGNTGWAAK